MELDNRIKDIGAIMTCFSIEAAKEYLGQKGYFTNSIGDYQSLEQFTDFRTLSEVTDDDTPFCTGRCCYQFFLPAEFVRPAEMKMKKWRPFTLDEFQAKFPLLSPVTFRRRADGVPQTFCFLGYDDKAIILGLGWNSFENLFDVFELKDENGNWTPFGVEE